MSIEIDEKYFAPLTDEMYYLYRSCINSGFDYKQAFELTKTYCTVAFANQSIRAQESKTERYRKALARYHHTETNSDV